MATIPLSLSVSERLDHDVAEQLLGGLRRHNESHTGPYDRQPLTVTARTADGTLAGGVTGFTQWRWLYVDYLWVAEDRRRSGLGSRLLHTAEEEAVRRGCQGARLNTFDFQAPDFYEKHGYRPCGVLEDYPPGHRLIWLRKTL